MSHPFLSESWIEAAKEIRHRYHDQVPKVTVAVKANQVITDAPFGDGTVRCYIDTSSGEMEMELGELESPDFTITTDYDTARKLFVEQDQQAVMQAFMGGKVKIQGDMMKMMAMQTSAAEDDISKQIATEIRDITA